MNATDCAPAPDTDGYITVREAARRCSLSERSVRDIIRNEALPHYRRSACGKILLRWSDFAAWMERRRLELKHDDGLLGILRDMKIARGRQWACKSGRSTRAAGI